MKLNYYSTPACTRADTKSEGVEKTDRGIISNDITDIKIGKNVTLEPILVIFPSNKSTISNEARVNLGFLAKAIKEGRSNEVH